MMDREERSFDLESKRRRLEALAFNLLQKRDEAVEYRSSTGVERRWREDEAAFGGMDEYGPNEMIDYATGTASVQVDPKSAPRSRVIVNVIRGRCETAEARFADIMLPTDDKNWGLKITPDPELAEQLHDDRPALQQGAPIKNRAGEQAKISDVAKDKRDRAKSAMQKMEVEIDDQLTECDYNTEQRKMIRQAVRLGTGILKGPSVVKATRRAWQKQGDVYEVQTAEVAKPASRWVDCWNVFPSPATTNNIQKSCEYIWERDEILPRHVKDLIGVKGYLDDQLERVLREEPLRTRTSNREGRIRVHRTKETHGKSYEYWEYNGDLDRDDLEALGIPVGRAWGKTVSACVIFVNERPVKIELNTLDTGDLPYDFFQWTEVSNDTPWGIGVPRQMIWLQGIITAGWRAMMDNAADSSGANVVVSKTLTPADGQWVIGGKRIWISEDDMEDARTAFAQFQLESRQPELQAIIELALRFVDLETSLPTIFQGEVQEIPETLGQTNIMVDSSNVGLRGRARIYDDRITDPHITRYYHFNMMYSDKAEIKGDFQVDARGVSVLLERDQQAQVIMELMAMKADPDVTRAVNWEKVTVQWVKSRRLDVLKTDEELKEYDDRMADAEGGPEDPRIVAAKIGAESNIKAKQIQAESDMAELQAKAEEAERGRQFDREMKQIERDIKMLDFATKYDISLDKLKTQLAISDRSLNLQERLSEKRATEEASTPPTEPAGKAPTGQSYER